MNLDFIKGQRKIAALVLIMAVGVSVDSLSKNGLTANLLDLLKYVGLGFFGGNAVEHLVGLRSGSATAESTDEAPVPEAPPEALINQPTASPDVLVTKLDAIGNIVATNQELVKMGNQAIGKLLDWVNTLPKRT